MSFVIGAAVAFALLATAFATSHADEIDTQLAIVAKVGAEGAGSHEAQAACRQLAAQGVDALPRILAAMDTPNLVAANWLRTVYDQIVDKELAGPSPKLPLATFKEFVSDAKRQGRVRRHLLATLDRVEPEFRKSYIAKCLDDAEFRQDAVDVALADGDGAKAANDTNAAIAAYEKAFSHARDSGQIVAAADKLNAAGKAVSIVEQMGLIVDWQIVGPFDAPGKTGFGLSFAPETAVDLNAQYDGKDGKRIAWKRYHATDRLGSIDLVQALAPVSEAIAYAYTELNAAEAQSAEVRCGADDNLTVWLNGERVFGREQWLNGIRLDRFIVPVELKKGKNTLLVKVCQGPQHSNPAVGNNWTLQIRICKTDGATAGLKSLLPPMSDEAGAAK